MYVEYPMSNYTYFIQIPGKNVSIIKDTLQ